MASKDSVPWKLCEGPAGITGALNLGHIHILASRHVVPVDKLIKFSQELHGYLRPGFDPDIPEHRPAKIPKGGREALKASKHLAAARRDIEKAQAVLSQLTFKNMFSHTGAPNPADQYHRDLVDAAEVVGKFANFIEVMERRRSVAFKGAPDVRVIRDIRREAICFKAFNLWTDLDRPLTYTTVPGTSERGGKLFLFIQDVVSCITQPPAIVNDAVLRTDLDRFKALQAEYFARSNPK